MYRFDYIHNYTECSGLTLRAGIGGGITLVCTVEYITLSSLNWWVGAALDWVFDSEPSSAYIIFVELFSYFKSH